MKEARCGCGALRVQVEGEREAVVACACSDCRRRSGGPFGMGVYYKRDQLTFVGEACEYTRPTDSGNTFTNAFCPRCARAEERRVGQAGRCRRLADGEDEQ